MEERELELEFALKIIEIKIADYIKNRGLKDKQCFLQGLSELVAIRNKIYKFDRKTIMNVLNEYKKENIIV